MIRRELTTTVADKLHLTASTVGQVLDVALELLLEDLVRTGRLEWRGFGTFSVRTYPPRQIHNPATGETIALPARRSVTFKPGAHLRSKLVDKKGARVRGTRRSGLRHSRSDDSSRSHGIPDGSSS